MTGQPMVTKRTVWGPKVSILKGTEASLSYVHCFLYFESSSVNVFFIVHGWIPSGQTLSIYHLSIYIYTYTYTHLYIYKYIILLNPFSFYPQPPTPFPSDSCQSVLCIYASVSISFVKLFCSVDFTYVRSYGILLWLDLNYSQYLLKW